MNVDQIKSEIEALSIEDRRQLAAHLVALRHRELAGYRSRMAAMIADTTAGNWLSLEEMDQRLES